MRTALADYRPKPKLAWMSYVTSLFARKMVAAAGKGNAAGLLASVGINAKAPWDPKAMIPADAYYTMLEQLAGEVDATELPVRVGASMRCDEYGALGLAWKAAPDLRGSLSRVERYARLWTSVVRYELRPDTRGGLYVIHRPGERRLGMRLSNETTLVATVALARQVSPVPVTPLDIRIKHAAPNAATSHESWFGCPVRWGAEFDAILFSPEALSRPNILGDEGISRYLLSHLDTELGDLSEAISIVEQARNAIAQTLNEGAPKMAHIAGRLGLSVRSFHRRLAEHGVSFQTLTEETRRDLAEGLLRDDAHSLAEIAFLTGFSEQSAFTRAFKRWMGVTPASYRKDRLTR